MCIIHTPHTSQQSFLGASPSTVGKGQSVRSCPRLLDTSTRHRSCLSVPHDMLHIYTLPGGEADPVPGMRTKDGKTLEPAEPLELPLLGKPGTLCVHWAKGSCSWKSVR